MKNKILVSVIVGLALLLSAGAVLAWDGGGFSWSRVEDKVASLLAGKVGSPDSQDEELGIATISRTGATQRAGYGSMGGTGATNTVAYWQNTTGRTIMWEEVLVTFDADDGIFEEQQKPVFVMSTSSNSGATNSSGSATTTPFYWASFTTSTAIQQVATSSFGSEGAAKGSAWQRAVADGEYILFMWAAGAGKSSPGTSTPSSTGSFNIRYHLK